MDTDQLVHDLRNLFEDDRRWNHEGRRIVFWYDPTREFEEAVDELKLDGVQLVKLDDTPFRLKYRLHVEEPDTPFLLYAPFAEPAPRDNWLLELQKPAQLFSADRAAMLMREFALTNRSLEPFLREHIVFFNNKRRVASLHAVGLASDSDVNGATLAMMTALTSLNVPDGPLLVRELLKGGFDPDENELYQEITKHFSEGELWSLIEREIGYRADTPSLRGLFVSLTLTHLERSLPQPLPERLAERALRPGTHAYMLIQQWMQDSVDAPRYAELSGEIARDLQIAGLAQELPPDAIGAAATFEAFDKALIQQIAAKLVHKAVDPAEVPEWVAARRPLYWSEKYGQYYDALEAAARLLRLEATYTFGTAQEPGELFEQYAAELYAFDQAYRHYIAASDGCEANVLDELTRAVERLYEQAFVVPLGETWGDALASLPGGAWEVPSLDPQWRFYARHVHPLLAASDREKAFVIISDAFRFEMARELEQELIKDLRGDAELTPMLGVLPSVTKLGMAALLPGRELTWGADVLRDGASTQGIRAREKVLQSTGLDATALKAEDVLSANRDDGREMVRPHRLIYIFHDEVDATGDNAGTERQVMDAGERAVQGLTELVKRLVNQLNATHVFVTADHGFLYQREDVDAATKLPMPHKDDALDTNRRYVLGEGLEPPPGTLRLTLPFLKPPGLEAIVPRGSVRFALQGRGAQYVHGGATLQEVCVPLLYYKHVRASKGDSGASQKVGVRISASSRKITTPLFTVRLLQEEPVGGRVRPRRLRVGLYDDQGAPFTDEPVVELGSIAEQATEREQVVKLSLGARRPPNGATCFLTLRDEEDGIEVLREAWTVSLSIPDDFGDF